MRAWEALRTGSVESRFDALHGIGLTELVGREEELEFLLRRWSRAKNGEGQVVLLSGEAGIGKSRLTASLMNVSLRAAHALALFCSPQHTDSALIRSSARWNAPPDRARRYPASEARQARYDARANLDLQPGRGAVCRNAVAAE